MSQFVILCGGITYDMFISENSNYCKSLWKMDLWIFTLLYCL